MIFKTPAKINLALDILKKEENGFHIIQTVYHAIPLFDEISIEKIKGKTEIIFKGEESDLIKKEDNTVLKALKLLNEKQKFLNAYKITVKKNIPVGAGLGGGSSDAAAVIKAFNELEFLGMKTDEMRENAAKISMDAPFFIEPVTALGTHYGEKILLLPEFLWNGKYTILILPPREKRKKTAERYAGVDTGLTAKNTAQTDALTEAVKTNDTEGVIKNLHNDFEIFEGNEFAHVKKILEEGEGALKALLCGSGTAVFAVSNNPFDLSELSRALPNQRILNLNQ